jgi:hypothetical protein
VVQLCLSTSLIAKWISATSVSHFSTLSNARVYWIVVSLDNCWREKKSLVKKKK